jgi:hypothetical protein
VVQGSSGQLGSVEGKSQGWVLKGRWLGEASQGRRGIHTEVWPLYGRVDAEGQWGVISRRGANHSLLSEEAVQRIT